jgi:hypothetical protein
VSLVSRRLPRLPAWWERPERQFRQWLPCPARDMPLAAAWTGPAGFDELAAAAKPWTLHGAAARPMSCERLDCAAECSGARPTARLRA